MKDKTIKGLLIGGMVVLPFPLSGILLAVYVGLNRRNKTKQLKTNHVELFDAAAGKAKQ